MGYCQEAGVFLLMWRYGFCYSTGKMSKDVLHCSGLQICSNSLFVLMRHIYIRLGLKRSPQGSKKVSLLLSGTCFIQFGTPPLPGMVVFSLQSPPQTELFTSTRYHPVEDQKTSTQLTRCVFFVSIH